MQHYVIGRKKTTTLLCGQDAITWPAPSVDVAVEFGSWLQERGFEVRLSDESEGAPPANNEHAALFANLLARAFTLNLEERRVGLAS